MAINLGFVDDGTKAGMQGRLYRAEKAKEKQGQTPRRGNSQGKIAC